MNIRPYLNSLEPKPRDTQHANVQLFEMSTAHIQKTAAWLNIPLTDTDIKTFLGNVETAIFKTLTYEHKYEGFVVSYVNYYTAHKYKMVFNLIFTERGFTIAKSPVDPSTMDTSEHTCRVLYKDSTKGARNFLKKKGVLPLKMLPLLINHESSSIKMFAVAKLQGLL